MAPLVARAIILPMVLALLGGCTASTVSPGWRASEALAGRAGAQGPSPLPDCPIAFSSVPKERLEAIAALIGRKVEFQVAVRGPYSVAVIEWIENHGRSVTTHSTFSRDDFVEGPLATTLKEHISKGREVYFYEAFNRLESGVVTGGQSGYAIVDHGKLIDCVVLRVVSARGASQPGALRPRKTSSMRVANRWRGAGAVPQKVLFRTRTVKDRKKLTMNVSRISSTDGLMRLDGTHEDGSLINEVMSDQNCTKAAS